MKTFLCIVLAALLLTPHAEALFGHTAAEKDRRLETEQQLAQEQQRTASVIHSNQQLHIVISILSAGAAIALVVGASIGSKTRRDHAE